MSKAAPSRPQRGRRKRTFCIVASRFNAQYVDGLVDHAREELRALAPDATVSLHRVPGAFEIPLVAKTLAATKRFDAVICLGAVIRGDTPHFDYISAEASRGIGQAALDVDVPIIFGVLTTDTVAQAIVRAEPTKFNRGGEAAKSAIEMATVMRMIRGSDGTSPSKENAVKNGGTRRPARKRTTI
jgi:6,7-dimethyl-8-ribityllumazine synthase